jgi:hypothetical protein
VVGNMIVPIELVQRVVDGMVERRFGRIVNITSSSVKMPLAGLDLSSGARAGPHRLPRRRRPLGGARERHHQLPPARPVRDRPPALRAGDGSQGPRRPGRGVADERRARTRPAASATRPSSARPARSCARRRPATSWGRAS